MSKIVNYIGKLIDKYTAIYHNSPPSIMIEFDTYYEMKKEVSKEQPDLKADILGIDTIQNVRIVVFISKEKLPNIKERIKCGE